MCFFINIFSSLLLSARIFYCKWQRKEKNYLSKWIHTCDTIRWYVLGVERRRIELELRNTAAVLDRNLELFFFFFFLLHERKRRDRLPFSVWRILVSCPLSTPMATVVVSDRSSLISNRRWVSGRECVFFFFPSFVFFKPILQGAKSR